MNNLPPGVSESMIPGNRPEDSEWEQFWEKLLDEFPDLGGEDLFSIDWGTFQKIVDWAHDKGFDKGYSRASDDAKMNLLYDQMEHEDMEGGDIDDDS